MPVLTSRQEPDDYDDNPSHPDEPPNEYAVRYLFGAGRNPVLDWRRSGKALVLFGFIGGLIAFGVMLGNLDFKLDGFLWLASALMLLSLFLPLSRIQIKTPVNNQNSANREWSALLPLVLLLVIILLFWVGGFNAGGRLGYVLYYLPSAACTFLGGFFLLSRSNL
jgi:hypothetical protein